MQWLGCSLGESRWRMVRVGLRLKRFRFEDTREMRRSDKANFDWLIENGFFQLLGDEVYQLTPKGVASADMGYYEWNLTPTLPKKQVNPIRKSGKK